MMHITLTPVSGPLVTFCFPLCSAYSSHSWMHHSRLISIPPPPLLLTASASAAFFPLRVLTEAGICEKEFSVASSMLFLFAALFPFRCPRLDLILLQCSSQSASKPRGWLAAFSQCQTATFREILVRTRMCRTRYPARYSRLDFHPFSESVWWLPQGSFCGWTANSLFSKVGSVEKLLFYLVLQIIMESNTCLGTVFFQHRSLPWLHLPVRLNQGWLACWVLACFTGIVLTISCVLPTCFNLHSILHLPENETGFSKDQERLPSHI